MVNNKVFSSLMMTLFPISLMLAVIIINPVHLLGYCIALFFSGLLWFTLHSLIVVLMYFIYQRKCKYTIDNLI